jgi:hypothetical protein
MDQFMYWSILYGTLVWLVGHNFPPIHTILPSLLVFFCCYVYFFFPFLPSWSEDTSTTITPFSLVITSHHIVTCDSKYIQKPLNKETLFYSLSISIIYTHLFLSHTHTLSLHLPPFQKPIFLFIFFSLFPFPNSNSFVFFFSSLFYPFFPPLTSPTLAFFYLNPRFQIWGFVFCHLASERKSKTLIFLHFFPYIFCRCRVSVL